MLIKLNIYLFPDTVYGAYGHMGLIGYNGLLQLISVINLYKSVNVIGFPKNNKKIIRLDYSF